MEFLESAESVGAKVVAEVLDALLFPAAVLDRAGTIVAVNDAWVRFAIENGPGDGRRPERTGPGTNYLAVCHGSQGPSSDHAEVVATGLAAVLEGRSPRFLHQYRCDSPTLERWFYLMATPRPGSAGGAVIVHADISPSRRIELENRELKSRLELGERLEAVGRLASGVAHDFNNMLSVILGHAHLALAATGPGETRESLEHIAHAAERSAALTRQLLALARRQPAVPCVLDVGLELAECTRLLRRVIHEDIEISLTLEDEPWRVEMDPQQFQHAFTNLCLNARDAIAARGHIALTVANVEVTAARSAGHPGARPGPHVEVRVADDGVGMTPEVLDHLFEPFFTTKATGLGTGLGLATVHGMVVQNGGFVEVRSAPGAGTVMSVLLPRTTAPLAESPAEAPHKHANMRCTVLVVEDEPALLELVTRMVREFGCTVLAAKSGAEALERLSAHAGPVDVVLTDVVMPGMNGREVVEALTAIRPGLRHLYMSGHVADIIARHGLLEPGTPFLQKPFGRDDLAREMGRLLKTSPGVH